MEHPVNGHLVVGRLVVGHVLRTHDLKGERDRRHQHQQGVDGGSVREAGRAEQARGGDVVDEICNSNQAGAGQ